MRLVTKIVVHGSSNILTDHCMQCYTFGSNSILPCYISLAYLTTLLEHTAQRMHLSVVCVWVCFVWCVHVFVYTYVSVCVHV